MNIPITFLHPKPKNTVHSVSLPFVNGQTKVKSNVSVLPEVNVSTTSPIFFVFPASNNTNLPVKPSVIPESLPPKIMKFSFVKNNSYETNSLTASSSMTSVPVSIPHEKVYNESFVKSHQAKSKKLSLPIETDYHDSALTSSNVSSENIIRNSWFSIRKKVKTTQKNLGKTSSNSVVISRKNIAVESRLNIGNLNQNSMKQTTRMIKIRLKLSPLLKLNIKLAIHVVQYLYNMCVEICCRSDSLRVPLTKSKWTPHPITLKALRATLLNKTTNILPENIWKDHVRVPYDIRDEAIRDFIKAFKIQTQLVKENKRRFFNMHYRKKKFMIQQSIVINHKHITNINGTCLKVFPRMWGNNLIHSFTERFPAIKHDSRLIMTNTNKFYLIIPVDILIKKKSLKYNAVGLDPGVRIFQTTYDTEGNSYMIGERDINKLDKLGKIASRMRSGMKRYYMNGEKHYRKAANRKERKGLRKAAGRIEERIKNKINDIHRKVAKFLCKKYDTIIIPKFETQNMARKKDWNGNWKRKINKDTTRRMIRWSHYRFRELLRAKGEEYGSNVVVGTEEWSSKTCGKCFKIKHNLGSNDMYNCDGCGIRMHRDVNGARNILMMNWDKACLYESTNNEERSNVIENIPWANFIILK